jgi:hypothetical protein
MAGAAGSYCATFHLANPTTTSSLKDKRWAHFGTDEDNAERVEPLLAGAIGLVCPAYESGQIFKKGANGAGKRRFNPKISGPFWWILGLKCVLIDMWGNDHNEMMFFYYQTIRSCTLLC